MAIIPILLFIIILLVLLISEALRIFFKIAIPAATTFGLVIAAVVIGALAITPLSLMFGKDVTLEKFVAGAIPFVVLAFVIKTQRDKKERSEKDKVIKDLQSKVQNNEELSPEEKGILDSYQKNQSSVYYSKR